ncbi:MAG: TlpA disulfide reductase family protein [Fulvivirga sp.]
MAIGSKLKNGLLYGTIVLLNCLLIGCSPVENNEKSNLKAKSSKVRFSYAIYNNTPQFEDEYMYDKQLKEGVKMSLDKLEWYHIDWNENGNYFDVGIDYIGVKSISDQKPIVDLLAYDNVINCNGNSYRISKKENFRQANLLEKTQPSSLYYINKFVDIPLESGTIISEEVLSGYDKTIIYFWASWCKPCIEKLSFYEQNKEKLAQQKIQVIPIYAKSSRNSIEEIMKKKGFTFEPLEISQESAEHFRLNALPQSYTFNEEGLLIK